MSFPARYRVEFRQRHRTRRLALLTDVKPHHRTLDPFVSHLVRAGQPGWVVLVDDHTDTPVARKRVQPQPA